MLARRLLARRVAFECIVVYWCWLRLAAGINRDLDEDEADEDPRLSYNFLSNSYESPVERQTLVNARCSKDTDCLGSSRFCLQGNCVKVCSERSLPDCVYFHCDGKVSIVSNQVGEQLIETNNHPKMEHYLANKKCSWILKNNNLQTNGTAFIRLTVERFSTEFANDYLYIFAGDSIYSPLVATLR